MTRARLPLAIERLALAGRAQVARVHDLRAKLAVAERGAFEAAHAMQLEALRLRRASRPRVTMPADVGPVGPLVSYQEPALPLGRMAPVSLDVARLPRGILVLA